MGRNGDEALEGKGANGGGCARKMGGSCGEAGIRCGSWFFGDARWEIASVRGCT